MPVLLPRVVEAGKLIQHAIPDVQFVIARAPHLHEELFAPLELLSPAPHVIVAFTTRVSGVTPGPLSERARRSFTLLHLHFVLGSGTGTSSF